MIDKDPFKQSPLDFLILQITKKFISQKPAAGYYDHPEGSHCNEKILIISKESLRYGCIAGILDAMAIRNIGSLIPALAHMFYVGSVTACAGAVGATTMCLLTRVRQKDDDYHAIYAGLAGSAVLGTFARTFNSKMSIWFVTSSAAYFMKVKSRSMNEPDPFNLPSTTVTYDYGYASKEISQPLNDFMRGHRQDLSAYHRKE